MQVSYETYTQWDGQTINYLPGEHLPPDRISEVVGLEAADMAAWYRLTHQDPLRPIHLLVPGVGPGTDVGGFIERLADNPDSNSLWTPRNVHITAFDISKSAVDIANENIKRHIQNRWGENSPVEFICFEGDWRDPLLLIEQESRFTTALANPPFGRQSGAEKETMRPGYESVPDDALYGGWNGQGHYRFVGPLVTRLLVHEPGAGAAYRLPRAAWEPAGREGTGLDYISGLFYHRARLPILQKTVTAEMIERHPGVQRVGSWVLLRWTDTVNRQELERRHQQLTAAADSEGRGRRWSPSPVDDNLSF